jgi:hypothetical protein
MTTLRELDARFMKHDDETHSHYVDSRADADGVMFLCPVCFAAKGLQFGSTCDIGVHSIICWEPSVPRDRSPGPGRWNMQGTGIDDLTLVAPSSSILLQSGCRAHFFVRDGKIATCCR